MFLQMDDSDSTDSSDLEEDTCDPISIERQQSRPDGDQASSNSLMKQDDEKSASSDKSDSEDASVTDRTPLDIPEAQASVNVGFYIGKRERRWDENPPPPSRTRAANIFNGVEGPTTQVESESEAFHLFITDEMYATIIHNTNKHARGELVILNGKLLTGKSLTPFLVC